jgi:hypothetical protein
LSCPIATLPGPSVSLLLPTVTDSTDATLLEPIEIALSPVTLDCLPIAIASLVLSLKLIDSPIPVILVTFLA